MVKIIIDCYQVKCFTDVVLNSTDLIPYYTIPITKKIPFWEVINYWPKLNK